MADTLEVVVLSAVRLAVTVTVTVCVGVVVGVPVFDDDAPTDKVEVGVTVGLGALVRVTDRDGVADCVPRLGVILLVGEPDRVGVALNDRVGVFDGVGQTEGVTVGVTGIVYCHRNKYDPSLF